MYSLFAFCVFGIAPFSVNSADAENVPPWLFVSYFMFNKKAGFNFETQMFENKVVVTESQIAGTSWGQDGLDAGHEYRVMSWNETGYCACCSCC